MIRRSGIYLWAIQVGHNMLIYYADAATLPVRNISESGSANSSHAVV